MFYLQKISRIIIIVALCALTLHWQCLAQAKSVQNDGDGGKHDDLYLKTSRRLLYSWDDDLPSYKPTVSTGLETSKIVYIVLAVVIVVVILIIQYCCKYGCENNEEDYSDAVVHPPPPRLAHTPPSVPVLSQTYNTALAPPSSSRSVILPPGNEQFSPSFIGLENPSFEPSGSGRSYYVPPNQNSQAMLDMPPDYDTVVRSDMVNPAAVSKRPFPKVVPEKTAGTSLPKYGTLN